MGRASATAKMEVDLSSSKYESDGGSGVRRMEAAPDDIETAPRDDGPQS